MNESASYIDAVGDSNAPETLVAPDRSRRSIRLRGGIIAASAWAVLVTGALLAPDPARYGTHEQMGLPACSMLQSSGWPCPTCGMTTSVSAMMHGRFTLAARSHPFGVLLAVGLLVLALIGAAELVSGRDVLRFVRPGGWWVWAIVIGLPAGWGLKILIGLIDGTLPAH